MAKNEDENAGFERELRGLSPDQLEQVVGIVKRVESEKTGDQFSKKINNMGDQEFARLKSDLIGN